MTTFYQIPLDPNPQQFVITLSGTDYLLTLTYANTTEGGWLLNIADSSGNPLINGIPLVTGCNLLEQYVHLGFAGGLWVQTLPNPSDVPTFIGLGSDSQLYWVTP